MFWISYLEEDSEEIAISCDKNPYHEMQKDGTYEVQVGKKDGSRLSEKVVFEVKDGYIKSINGNILNIRMNEGF